MSAKPHSRSRLRFALFGLFSFVLLLVFVAGTLLHWDDQLRLLWQEQRTSVEQRAASVWLPDYELVLQARLLGLEEDETSGLTWNPATGTLFTVTGQNPQLIELTPGGVVLRRVRLTGFSDPEAVEALSDGRLGIVDERRRLVAVFNLPPGVESLDLDQMAAYDLGFPSAGNKGFEGLAWNPRTHRMLLAKERDPQGLYELPFPGEDGAAGVLEALPSQPLLVRDISSVTIDPTTGHTLMLSDESRLLVELDLLGRPRSFISLFGGLNGLVEGIDQAEGVAMDARGDIYVIAEPNLLYVFRRKR
ncbi:SdiA-regulated domain-containing protein [Stutzerimonas chloritidismutans]|uniref:SdiA-regulated domain-containing protein n=1 Tax=Stutzerimonas chloritidismutans TaxID=203192 RepID=UPI003F16AE46